jgi:hypothetical protein
VLGPGRGEDVGRPDLGRGVVAGVVDGEPVEGGSVDAGAGGSTTGRHVIEDRAAVTFGPGSHVERDGCKVGAWAQEEID